MKFYIDLTTRQFVRGPASGPLATTFFKRRDAFEVEIIFVDRAAIVPTPAGTSFLAGVKAHFGGDFLALSDSSGLLNLHTTAVEALFADEPEKVPALFEIKTFRPGEETRTHTLGIELQNAVILGDESLPIDSPSLKASTSDAQAGLDNTKWMTPLRTAEAIAALAPTGGGGGSPVTWSTLSGKPSTFPPSTHTHAYADITGKPSTFSPSAHTHAASQITGLAAVATSGDFADLTNKPTSLPPSAHSHAISEVTGLSAALDAKQPAGNYASTTHTHSAADITTGTIDPARLPVLPSSIQVVSSSTIPNLTLAEQNQIVAGAVVTTSDGGRWIYRSGSKTNTDSYVKLADLTPDWSVIANKPAVFPPTSHSHAIADVTGLDTALAGKQPAGSYATAAQGALADTASQPGHTHSTSQITGLDTSLASKISGTGVAAIQVVQSLPATLVPTTFYILIPSGATAATSVQLGSIPLFTGSGGGGTTTSIVTSGLIFHLDSANTSSYSGTGTTWNDISGNGYSATLINGPTLLDGNMVFDGIDDYATTNFNASLQNFTACVWFKASPGMGESWNRILDKDYLSGFWLGRYSIYDQFGGGALGGPAWAFRPFVPATWNFIAMRRSATTLTTFANGSADSASVTNPATATSAQALRIAAHVTAPVGEFFKGSIPIIKIYNRALTDAEIQQNYDARKSRFGL